MSFKAELAERLRAKFDLDEIADSVSTLMSGATVKTEYRLTPGGKRVPIKVTETVRPQDRAKGLILLDAIAFNGELGMSPRTVEQGDLTDLYRRFSSETDARIVQNTKALEHDE
ncbi:MAG: hypothetical protein CL484_12120 [Acidobacteria bacterium]|nr:hypothetical protein [Acidobacteriota bacterium]|tara:strand:+ start:2715 stop:3056 length:342 start_codon:yes stop_codon:yes gene_type:complete